MYDKIREAILRLDRLSDEKMLRVISHYDSDGITSAAIFSRMLSRWGKHFSLEIVKGLDEQFIRGLSDDQVLIFLDLGSGSLDYFRERKTEVFIFDHHEISGAIPGNVVMINPMLFGSDQISAAAVCYLVAKCVSVENRDLAALAVIGMVGDLQERVVTKMFNEILNDADLVMKKGLMIYPSTRPLDRALEYSSAPYIPGVSGSYRGAVDLLREVGLESVNGRYKALYELNEEEMGRLITAVAVRCARHGEYEGMIGTLYLLKFFNTLEDARELSALINACSRMGSSAVALGFCLGNRDCRQQAERIYIEYRRSLMAALTYASGADRITGKDYIIIHGKDYIKDTIIGTVASIISHSPLHPEGLVVIALAYNEDKIKVSARIAGRNGRNVREVLHRVVVPLGGEVGGHPHAAGCLISREQESVFLDELQKVLVDGIKV